MIIHADILEWCETYEGEPFQAVLCDPPYGLNEAELDIGAVLTDWTADREHTPKGAGFMGRDWDAFLPGPRIWRAIRACCYPGAYLFAFGGTRTADLLALALRLAGWVKVDEIAYCYGSGFPKNHHIGRAIDRAAKADRPVVGTKKHQPKFDAAGFEYRKKDNGYNSKARETFDLTIPASDLSLAWDGHGTALKPAHEPILVFRNPFRGTYAQNCTKHGAGALNIDGGRIGTQDRVNPAFGVDGWRSLEGRADTYTPSDTAVSGRWPANLILQHSSFCNGTCVPDCPVRCLGEQSGESESKASQRGAVEIFDELYKRTPSWHGESTERGHNDTGTAARFFFNADYLLDRLEQCDPVAYHAKASRSEREAGLDPRQIALLGEAEIEGADAESIGALRDGGRAGRIVRRQFAQDTINDGREKPIDNPYQRGKTVRRNLHPTLKPLSLCRYLATLLLPPDVYAPRRLLIPFAGAGSEMIGAELAGWEEVVGVELEADHVRIAEARLAYWKQRRYELGDPGKAIRAVLAEAPDGQLDMFGGEG